jgi:hypothetical protein
MNCAISHDQRLPLYQRLRDELAARITDQQWRRSRGPADRFRYHVEIR